MGRDPEQAGGVMGGKRYAATAATLLLGAALALGGCAGDTPAAATDAPPNIAMVGDAVRSGVAVSIESDATPRIVTGSQRADPATGGLGSRSIITVDFASGEHCVGRSRLQSVLESGGTSGPLLLACNDRVLWDGTYITFDAGYGLARLHGSNGAAARMVYGGDVPEGPMDLAAFEALWQARPETIAP
jgi:hypothetical protein